MTPIASRPHHGAPSDDPSASCHRTRTGLSAFVDGEASAAEAADVLSHVSRCEACRRAERGLRPLIVALRRSHVPVLASRRLQLRVTQLFAEQEQRVAHEAGEADARVPHTDQV